MAKVRKRIWTTKTGEHTAWVADYFSPGPDGKRQRHTKTFATRKEANAWLAHTQGHSHPGACEPDCARSRRAMDCASGNGRPRARDRVPVSPAPRSAHQALPRPPQALR